MTLFLALIGWHLQPYFDSLFTHKCQWDNLISIFSLCVCVWIATLSNRLLYKELIFGDLYNTRNIVSLTFCLEAWLQLCLVWRG